MVPGLCSAHRGCRAGYADTRQPLLGTPGLALPFSSPACKGFSLNWQEEAREYRWAAALEAQPEKPVECHFLPSCRSGGTKRFMSRSGCFGLRVFEGCALLSKCLPSPGGSEMPDRDSWGLVRLLEKFPECFPGFF